MKVLKVVLSFLLICTILVGCSTLNASLTDFEKKASDTNGDKTISDIDSDIVDHIYLLRFEKGKDDETKRDVTGLINQGIRMTAHFYSGGRGYFSPSDKVEKFTWGGGDIFKGEHKMSYTVEDNFVVITDAESGYQYWYERTDEKLGEYPVSEEISSEETLSEETVSEEEVFAPPEQSEPKSRASSAPAEKSILTVAQAIDIAVNYCKTTMPLNVSDYVGFMYDTKEQVLAAAYNAELLDQNSECYLISVGYIEFFNAISVNKKTGATKYCGGGQDYFSGCSWIDFKPGD